MSNYRSSRFSQHRPSRPRFARRGADAPILMGEPSPSLAKINTMNMARLEEKIASLDAEFAHLTIRIGHLREMPNPPEDKIEAVNDHQERLSALKAAAA